VGGVRLCPLKDLDPGDSGDNLGRDIGNAAVLQAFLPHVHHLAVMRLNVGIARRLADVDHVQQFHPLHTEAGDLLHGRRHRGGRTVDLQWYKH